MRRIVKIGNHRLSKEIFSSELLMTILFVPFFKTSGFDIVPGLSSLCNAMIAIECVVFLALNLLERRFTRLTIWLIILELWIYGIAPFISGAERPSSFYVMGALGLISFFEMGFTICPDKLMRAVARLFAIMITLNALMLLLMPNGFIVEDGTRCYLFGLRTGFSLFIIPAVMFTLLRDKRIGKISFYTVIIVVVGAYSLINQWVATGIFELVIIFVLLLIMRRQGIAEKINFVWVAGVLFALDISLTIFASQSHLLNIISIIFAKDVTLSGRTEIWRKVLVKLSSSPIGGVGNDAVVNIGVTMRPAHNQWLHAAMEGGYVAMAILMIAVVLSSIYLYKHKKAAWYPICAICMIAIMVGSITEIQTYVPFFYIVFDMPYLLAIWDEKNAGANTYETDRKQIQYNYSGI